MNKELNINYEDEIDLRELFKTIYKKRFFLILFTFFITIVAITYAYNKQEIYEVKSTIKIGYIGYDQERDFLDNPASIVKKLNVVFEVEDKTTKVDEFISEVTSISQNKKVPNFIEIKTAAISNEEALKKNKEVLAYLKNQYKDKLDLEQRSVINEIEEKQRIIKNIDEFEVKNLEHELNVIEKQKLVKIDDKINLYITQIIPSIDNKIKFHTKKLDEYTKSINNIMVNMENSKNSSSLTILSIQMVNYQNLMLNSQNEIEDLKTSKKTIEVETIPILEREKQNIKNDTLRKLKHKIDVDIVNKKIKIKEQIESLEFKLSNNYMRNSSLVGKYVVKDGPSKPNKKLIVVVSFVTSFILGIFIVFILEFIGKKEEVENI